MIESFKLQHISKLSQYSNKYLNYKSSRNIEFDLLGKYIIKRCNNEIIKKGTYIKNVNTKKSNFI